eukprot:1355306-Karenia_brevis.AAC.1
MVAVEGVEQTVAPQLQWHHQQHLRGLVVQMVRMMGSDSKGAEVDKGVAVLRCQGGPPSQQAAVDQRSTPERIDSPLPGTREQKEQGGVGASQ